MRIGSDPTSSNQRMALALQDAMGGSAASGEIQLVDLPADEALQGVLDGRADLVVMPATELAPLLPLGLVSEIVMRRRDPRTVSITRALPPTPLRDLAGSGAVVCPTPREEALLRVFHPQLQIHPSSGGGSGDEATEGALGLVSRGEAAAALLPAWKWGMHRIDGLGAEYLGRTIWMPTPGEGGTAVVYSISNPQVRAAMGPLVDFSTRGEVMSELAFAEAVDALPDAVVLATGLSYGAGLRLWGLLLDQKGERAVRVDRTGELEAPEPLGWALAADTVARSSGVLS